MTMMSTRVSAGHELHEWTTWSAMDQIFGVMRMVKEGQGWKGEEKVEGERKEKGEGKEENSQTKKEDL